MRIPKYAPQPPPTNTTTLPTEHSAYKALLAEILQIGDPISNTSSVDTYSATPDHPPFNLPIPKLLIDLYQLGNDNARIAQEEALLTIQQGAPTCSGPISRVRGTREV